MGGMGGRSKSGSMFEDDDMNGSFSGFGGGMPGGMPRRSSPSRHNSQSQYKQRPPSPPNQPSEITRPLKVSLQELYSGSVKHLKVGRRLLDGSTEDKILEIQIHPGWKSGTKIRFPRAGNEQAPHGDSQDLVFVVEEKPHETFTREGNDLLCRVPISLVEALTGSPGGKIVKSVEMLDGRRLQVTVPSGVVKPGQEMIVLGEGMPIRKDGSVKKKGDLIVRWEVAFPDRLTPAQQEGVRNVLG
jgi:DnaJ family protein B protein 4